MTLRLEQLTFARSAENLLWQFCQQAKAQEKALPSEQRFRGSGGIAAQLELYGFWGTPIIGVWQDERLIGVDVRSLPVKEWPVWGRYVKNYVVYVLPEFRRGGTARTVYTRIKQQAYELGCTRLTTRAQSWYGATFHFGMGHQFWGQTPNGEFLVDTPLDDRLYPDVPPEPLHKWKVRLWCMTKADIAAALRLPPYNAAPERVDSWLNAD